MGPQYPARSSGNRFALLALAQMTVDRQILLPGSTSVERRNAVTDIYGQPLLLAWLLMLNSAVIAPLSRMTRRIVNIGDRDDVKQRPDFVREDEFGVGLRLHWCANAIRSIHGSIELRSEGVGKDGCLHRSLPLAAAGAAGGVGAVNEPESVERAA